jgi:hypothetical protein
MYFKDFIAWNEFRGRQMLLSNVQFGAFPTRLNKHQMKPKWHIWNACDFSFPPSYLKRNCMTIRVSAIESHVSIRGYGYVSRIRTRIRATMGFCDKVIMKHHSLVSTLAVGW